MHWDATIHIAEIVVFAGFAWRGIAAINRLSFIMENFPPHRHHGEHGEHITYPKGMAPEAEMTGATHR